MKNINLNLKEIAERAIAQQLKDDSPALNEALVAEPKKYKQTTEYVSEKAKNAHRQLYEKYVKAFNEVSAKLDTVDKNVSNSMHSSFRSLKLDEIYNANAVYLHELFFSNSFDPNSEVFIDSVAYMKLQKDFGTFDDWQKDFIACALSCGEGWAVTGYNIYTQRYMNTMISHHSQDVMVGLIPLIVVDCWSHAYFKDNLIDQKKYIVSILRELNWDIIEKRFENAEKIARILK
jgi:Fe-Mn family superoxide dismutase